MKILVTGGTGYLGTHVRAFFSADDFSRRSQFSVTNSLDARVAGDYDVVIHLAAFMDKSPSAAQNCFHVNCDGTANIIRSMRAGSTLIFASTKDVYGPYPDNWDETPETCLAEYAGQSAFEWSKLIAEKYIQYYAAASDIRHCIFRLSTVYAPITEGNEYGFVNHYVESIRNGERLSLPGNGEPKRDLLFVDDFSAACRAFIDSDKTVGLYNLGGGRANASSLNDLVRLISRITENEAKIDREHPLPMPIPRDYVSDISRAEYEIGWKPSVGIEEGLRRLL